MDDYTENAEVDNSEKNKQIGTSYEDSRMLEHPGSITFEDVDDIITYVDKKLSEKV